MAEPVSGREPTRAALARIAWCALVLLTASSLLVAALLDVPVTLDSSIVPAFLAYGVVGAVVTWRRPATPLGWVFLLVGALTSVQLVASAYTLRELRPLNLPQPLPGADAVIVSVPLTGAMLAAVIFLSAYWMVLVCLSTTMTVLLFPGPPSSQRWRIVLWVSVAGIVTMELAAATGQLVPLNGDFTVFTANPLSVGLPWDLWRVGGAVFVMAAFVVLLIGLARVVAMVVDYRRSDGVERLQLRWFALAAVLFLPLNVLAGVVSDVSPVLSATLTFVAFLLIPVSCAVAILRYHLYDIDRVISRTASYASVSVVVVATYALVVAFVTSLLPDKSSALPVAAATLAAAAVFRPVLRQVQQRVDRRFDRARYDASRTVEEFAHRLRTHVDPTATAADLVGVIGSTVAPTSVGLWWKEAS